jgi:hypothetical protein
VEKKISRESGRRFKLKEKDNAKWDGMWKSRQKDPRRRRGSSCSHKKALAL